MLEPTTMPTGSKPASLTSRNSLTVRSLVNIGRVPPCPVIWPRRSRACCGRSGYGLLIAYLPGLSDFSLGGSSSHTPCARAIFKIEGDAGCGIPRRGGRFDDGSAPGEVLDHIVVEGTLDATTIILFALDPLEVVLDVHAHDAG